MTFFIVIGMIILFIVGFVGIFGSLFLLYVMSALGGRLGLSEFIPCSIIFGIGCYSWYYLFTHLSINVGVM